MVHGVKGYLQYSWFIGIMNAPPNQKRPNALAANGFLFVWWSWLVTLRECESNG